MADQKLISYLQAEAAKGVSLDDARNQLIQQGWPITDVDSAVLTIREVKRPKVLEKKTRPTVITFLSGLGILLSLGLMFFGVYSLVLGFISNHSATNLLNNLSSFVPFLFLIVTPRMVTSQLLIASTYLFLVGLVSVISNILLFRMKKSGFLLFMASQAYLIGGNILQGNLLSIHGTLLPVMLSVYMVTSKDIFS